MIIHNLCLGCMQEKTGDKRCPYCSWVEGMTPESPIFLPPGTVLENKYLIGRVLGQGGFGITYLSWDINLNMKLAIKEYFPQEIASRAAGQTQISIYSGSQKNHYDYGLEKFLQEARTLAQFEGHPNIVSVRDFFKANGTAYFVMNYVEGITLQKYLADAGGILSFSQALQVILPVLDALKEVHSVNVLHRDISPDNIYINNKGQVVLLDFGAARQAIGEKGRSLSIILKPGYAPEEQYRTKGEQGPWTDIYAVAATTYHLITSKQPPEALERMIGDTLEKPSALGIEIGHMEEKALLKALSVKAVDRYQTVQDFQDDLHGQSNNNKTAQPPLTPTVAIDYSQSVPEVVPEKRVKKKSANKSLPLFIGIAALVFVLVGFLILRAVGLFSNGSDSDLADYSIYSESFISSDYGNSGGNIVNGGLVATGNRWAFYRSNEGGSLYRRDLSDGGSAMLSADAAWFINHTEDWVYYSNRDDNNRLYKVMYDGTGRSAISDSGSWFLNISSDWLYYLDENDNYKIYRIRNDGTGKSRIGDDMAWSIIIYEDWIYYINRSDEGKIYRIRTDASSKEKINNDRACCINIDGDWIYYINEVDGNKIYRINIDGSVNYPINDHSSAFLNYYDGYIYYSNEDDNGSLNRIRPDGSERIKLANELSRFINVSGGWIYFYNHQNLLIQMSIDGSQRMAVEGQLSDEFNIPDSIDLPEETTTDEAKTVEKPVSAPKPSSTSTTEPTQPALPDKPAIEPPSDDWVFTY